MFNSVMVMYFWPVVKSKYCILYYSVCSDKILNESSLRKKNVILSIQYGGEGEEGWPHCCCGQEAEKAVLNPLSVFCEPKTPAHSRNESSLFSLTSLETSSELHCELCLGVILKATK